MDRRGPALTSGSPGAPGRSSWFATGALLVAPVAFFGVFFAAPVLAILVEGLRRDGTWDLGVLTSVITDPEIRGVAWFTTWQAAVSTVVTTALALPMAYVLARSEFRGKAVVRALVVVPFVLPTVVVGTAFLVLLGPDGPVAAVSDAVGLGDVDLRRTVPAIICAHAFFNYAVVARTVGSAWAALDPSTEEAARTLGASRRQAFTRIVLPQLRPAVGSAAAIVFLFSFTSFGVIKILGGPRLATIEVEIHRLTTQLLDLRGAAVLSLLQMGAVVATLTVHGRLSRTASSRGVAYRDPRSTTRRARGAERLVLAGTLLSAGVLLLTPMLTLVERSFSTADGYGLAFYRDLSVAGRGTTAFVAPVEAIRNSLMFGAAAAGTALVVGTLASLALVRLPGRAGRVADSALTLPLGTSAVTVGFGFLIALDSPPLDLRTSPVLIPAAQALIAVPFVIRTLVPALRAVDPGLREAAAVLGARPARVMLEVDLRMLVAPMLVALGFAAAISLGEFGATLFIVRADAPTVPVAIFRALDQPGATSLGRAMALSTILMALTAAVMLAVDRVRGSSVGTFA